MDIKKISINGKDYDVKDNLFDTLNKIAHNEYEQEKIEFIDEDADISVVISTINNIINILKNKKLIN